MTRTLRKLARCCAGAAAASPLLAAAALADTGLPAFTVQRRAGGGQTYTLTLQVLVLMTACPCCRRSC